MNDFASRLERELVEAARREKRRAHRPRFARRAPALQAVLPALLVTAAVAAVVFVLAPALHGPDRPPPPARPGPVPAMLAGNYANGDVRLILDRRRYTLLIAGQRPVTGTVTAQGRVLALEDDGEGACRATTQPARYLASFAQRQLRLQPLSDRCKVRAHAFEQPLRRDQ